MAHAAPDDRRPWSIFLIFLRLGLTSFGGPVAHLGYFRQEFISRRGWLSEAAYAELIAIAQFMPGATSSKVGMAIGLSQAGYRGALAAWLGFTLPSALLLMAFAYGLAMEGGDLASGALHGLKIVAAAIVAQAVWGMARALCPDTPRRVLMLLAAGVALLVPGAVGQLAVIISAGLLGVAVLKSKTPAVADSLPIAISRRAGALWLVIFVSLLAGLPLLAHVLDSPLVSLFEVFYRTGALVFGGGHVMLPLLQAEVVPNGWLSNDLFLAGYGATQAVPGPLFTFAAFLGTAIAGVLGGLLCLLAIFAPSFLLLVGVLPFWARLRTRPRLQAAMAGVNAGVVGLLLATLYQPVGTGAVSNLLDVALVLLALLALMAGKLPPWLVVVAGALIGWLVL
ncbi:chromate efflux transporter [Pseudomonas argentinensis]|uniref:Chromate transporter n=1 Tax=Phytopseudomonas argentinensis TaxID=289370 RepID=A0A1I3JPK5_9GAMM|nr:chromate efflux transporter [Pseudomonas argentinensis]KAB0551089.1 chromate efflux transporter [Pseudomonas argentinensis]SFI62084.1 chromate transporter [Pseudomonas argentinensis]